MDSVKDYRRRRRQVIGRNMRARREELRLSEREVAHELWMRVADYRRYELGLHEPGAGKLMLIAAVLDTNVEALTRDDRVPA